MVSRRGPFRGWRSRPAKHGDATSEKQSIVQVAMNYGSYSICRCEFQTCKLVRILIITQLELPTRFVMRQLTPDSLNDLLAYIVPTLCRYISLYGMAPR